LRHRREILAWAVAGLAGVGLLYWALPRFFPLLPSGLEIDRKAARTIALERLRDLAELPQDAYVVTRLRADAQLDRRLQLALDEIPAEKLRDSALAAQQLVWETMVYPPGAGAFEASHIAWISPRGEVLQLRHRGARPAAGEKAAFDAAALSEKAADYLTTQGIDLSLYESQPRIQRGELDDRDETVVRFRSREPVLGPEFIYGQEVFFEGGQLRGHGPFFDEPRPAELQDTFREVQLVGMLRVVLTFILVPLAALPFLRLYHEGLIGVRRGLRLMALCAGCALVVLALHSDILSAGSNLGLATRQQNTWLFGIFSFVFLYLSLALLALMSWSVGEVLCRRKWPQKLASLDALLTFRWQNSTLARSAFRGYAAGLLMAGIVAGLTVWAQRFGVFPMYQFIFDETLGGPLPGFSRLLSQVAVDVPYLFFAGLLVPAWAFGRFGKKTGLLLSVLAFMLVVAVPFQIPLAWGWALWLSVALLTPLLFLRGDVLSAMVAPATANLILLSFPLLLPHAAPRLQVFGWLSLVVFFLPGLISLRHLFTGQELSYSYEDVPPHVRRIAERERQRVELETARGIQSAILPDLPPLVSGIELAHAYLPATEVGGDFYDVLALEDGRVAVAIGDVAGHGVSSGLVMSMAKSALTVQVGFDPEVAAVFSTLNRMVYHSARRRLLSTLCYALVDPYRHRVAFASAGHVFPYRVGRGGQVEALESIAYPLGVRKALAVQVREQVTAPGDALFLFSDGLVEASREGDDEPFGFDRLEKSLAQHAGKSATGLRDAVIADVRAFTRYAPQTDDLTVLVLRLPAA
jgi:hypothetical protein